MKKSFYLLLCLLFITSWTSAQSTAVKLPHLDQAVISNYLTQPDAKLALNEFRVLFHMNYGASDIKNSAALRQLYGGKIKRVNLYYSAFPQGKNFDKLNQQRITKLLDLTNGLIQDEVVWTVYRQTDCSNSIEAQKLFHGFEVILEFSADINLTALRIDSSFQDFVVEKVLSRNDWKDMLIVTDMTGSMGPYYSQLFLWLKLNTIDDRIKQFVFFNDGDTQLDKEKVIGSTGGIYQTKSKQYEEVEKIAIQSMLSGNGGDGPENDAEALLTGLKLCPNCKENILIADNKSSVRDLELIQHFTAPIRIIICGSDGKVNAEYLNIARRTNGSIHLMEQDLFELMKFNEGETLEINGSTYKIQDNQFVEIKKT